MDTNSLTAVAQAAATAASNANYMAMLNTIIVSIIGLLGVVVTTTGTILLAKINANAKGAIEQSQNNGARLIQTHQVAMQAVAQSTANSEKLVEIAETGRRTYHVVNKPFGVVLESAATTMEYVASLDNATDEQRQAARTARKASNEHRQAMLEYENNERVTAALANTPPQLPV